MKKRGLLERLTLASLVVAGIQLTASGAFADTTIRMWTFLNPEGTSPR